MRYSFQDRPVSKFGPPIWNCDKSHFSQFYLVARRARSAISDCLVAYCSLTLWAKEPLTLDITGWLWVLVAYCLFLFLLDICSKYTVFHICCCRGWGFRLVVGNGVPFSVLSVFSPGGFPEWGHLSKLGLGWVVQVCSDVRWALSGALFLVAL